MTRRILAKRLLTNEVLSYDLPVKENTPIREVNGPGGVSGTILADVALARATDGRPLVQQWSTALYVVEDGEILCGGPVTNLSDKGDERTFIASGFTAWPNGTPFLDSYYPDDFESPVAAYRALWSHLQSFPDGNIGMNVDDDPTYLIVGNGEAPYSIIQTEYRDVGAEMTNLLAAARIDYQETHTFTGGPDEAIRHAVRLGFPRLGANRHSDTRFVEDENVIDVAEATYGGDDFSQDITVIGQGEGWAAIDDGMVQRRHVPDGRLRRAVVVADPSLTSSAQVVARAEDEYEARRDNAVVESFTIRDHPNARIRDLNPGDDVILTYTSRFETQVQTAYVRITSIEEPSSDPDTAVITCAPSDSFIYFPTANPNTDGTPYLVEV